MILACRLKKQELVSVAQSAKTILQEVQESVRREFDSSLQTSVDAASEKTSKEPERAKIVISIQDKDEAKHFRVYMVYAICCIEFLKRMYCVIKFSSELLSYPRLRIDYFSVWASLCLFCFCNYRHRIVLVLANNCALLIKQQPTIGISGKHFSIQDVNMLIQQLFS